MSALSVAERRSSLPNPDMVVVSDLSVSNAMDIPLELERLRDTTSFLETSEQSNFVKRQLENFLLEHAGYVQYSEFDGSLSPATGDLVVQGFHMNPSWQRTVDTFGEGSREHYEVIGVENAVQMLQDGHNCVFISSPQKEGAHGYDRRLSFIYIVEPIPNSDKLYFRQINVTHLQEDVHFAVALQEYAAVSRMAREQALDPTQRIIKGGDRSAIPDMPDTLEDMLTRPIGFNFDSPDGIDSLLSVLKIGETERRSSARYTHYLNQKLAVSFTEYVRVMMLLKDVLPAPHPADIVNVEDLRDRIFEAAEAIKRDLESGIDISSIVYDPITLARRNRTAIAYGLAPRPQLRSKTTCPNRPNSLPNQSVTTAISKGTPWSRLLSDPVKRAEMERWSRSHPDRSDWKWTDGVTCNDCKKKNTLAGPCDVCTECQIKYDLKSRKRRIERA